MAFSVLACLAGNFKAMEYGVSGKLSSLLLPGLKNLIYILQALLMFLEQL